jgi:hydrogenase maturation protein HypF
VNSDAARVRRSVRVTGTVQGVGFRPFVYSLATRLGLSGFVGNDSEGVFAEIEGSPAAVAEFLVAIERDAPPLARIDQVVCTDMQPYAEAGRRGQNQHSVGRGGQNQHSAGRQDQNQHSPGFTIVPSAPGAQRTALVSADSAMCADCLAELRDPADRRHAYPFINCTNCGPRFTIVADVPYDRPNTTMAPFAMCERCAAEYHDPANRRFHAQPVCCPACGPRLSLRFADGSPQQAGDPLAAAAALLRDGQVLAVKGLGGYHLAVDARSEEAAAALRARKHREDKPFAVMAADLAAAQELAEVDQTAAALLASPRRPIVLLPRRPGTVAAAVAPGNRALGVMLPYTPLHHLLLEAVGGPIVLTSGNLSDEPIAYRDEDAFERLAPIADAFLTHDRAIHIRTDDSVSRILGGVAGSALAVCGREMVIRRSRGHVPEPITTAHRFPRPVLACGAELKNTFCLAKDDRAFVSHHIGDLENAATLRSFTEGIEHFGRLFGIEPEVVAYDLHPEYLSTKFALDLDLDSCGVQHHHAHIASCLADNGHEGPVIGVAFDGTGFGTDGTLWGGEFLVADLAGFERAGHLEPVPMPGGAAAIRQPWRMAAAYLRAAFPGGPPSDLDVVRRNGMNWANVVKLAQRGVNAPLSSSAGRLFDAVAALLSVRDTINYEGQAAVELEQLADPGETGSYRAAIIDGPSFRIQGASLVQAVTGELTDGAPAPVIAARFHNGIAALIEEGCVLARQRYGLDTVALSGGVFQNLLVTERAAARLEACGFQVLLHSRVPCNDGGISLGQAVVAAARDRASGPQPPGPRPRDEGTGL